MSWISRNLLRYNVTIGLYMLDWWERLLFNMLILTLLWFIGYNGSRFATEFYDSHLKLQIMAGESFPIGGSKLL